MSHLSKTRSDGFTLIELITVIIVLGVVSVGISGFIRTGVEIYTDTTERDQLLGNSRFLVERLNRELRMAVPNSIRVKNNPADTIQCIEFVPAKWVSFYTTLPKRPDTSDTVTIVEIADNPAGYQVSNGDFAIVYPTNSNDVYNVYNNKRRQITACVDGYSNGDNDCNNAPDPNDDEHTAKLTVVAPPSTPSVPSTTAAFDDHSPASRLYFVTEVISYCLRGDSDEIYRHQGNIFNIDQLAYDSGGVLMAENMVNTISSQPPFQVIEPSLARNGLVQMLFRFELNEEIVNYSNEVHIPNVP